LGKSKAYSGNPSSPFTSGATLKFLIDECLHTSLVQVAQASGYVADHVNYLSLGGLKDWQLLPVIREREYTFVTNNGADFLALFGKEPLHPGIIIIVPNVTPILQRELFKAALGHIGARDLTNCVVEVKYVGDRTVCSQYAFPESTE
jgi:predicted nuclease of predicted toxin-antitoxin system